MDCHLQIDWYYTDVLVRFFRFDWNPNYAPTVHRQTDGASAATRPCHPPKRKILFNAYIIQSTSKLCGFYTHGVAVFQFELVPQPPPLLMYR